MHVTIVHVHVKPDHIDDFIAACKLNHDASVRETGNRRFDVLQSPDKPNWFVLYEAYDNAEHADEHKQTAHYAAWRDTVADWMETPRKGLPFTGLYPAS